MNKDKPKVDFHGSFATPTEVELATLQVKHDLSSETSKQKNEIVILRKEVEQLEIRLDRYISNIKYLLSGILFPITVGIVIYVITHLPKWFLIKK